MVVDNYLTDCFRFQKPIKEVKKYGWNSTIPISKATTIARKKKNPKKRTKRVKLIPLPRLVKRADSVFSVWIRNRDKHCVLCNSTTNLQCGHLFKRSKKLLRYSEINCSCLCSKCNYKDNFEHDHYVSYFLGKYGEKKYAELYVKSLKVHKFTRDELQSIIEKYAT